MILVYIILGLFVLLWVVPSIIAFTNEKDRKELIEAFKSKGCINPNYKSEYFFGTF